MQGIRLLLMPFEAAKFAVDADVEIVLLADRDLRGMQDTFGSIFETEQDVTVVIKGASVDEGGKICGKFLDLEAGDIFRKILGMGTDVPDASGGSGSGRIGAP